MWLKSACPIVGTDSDCPFQSIEVCDDDVPLKDKYELIPLPYSFIYMEVCFLSMSLNEVLDVTCEMFVNFVTLVPGLNLALREALPLR